MLAIFTAPRRTFLNDAVDDTERLVGTHCVGLLVALDGFAGLREKLQSPIRSPTQNYNISHVLALWGFLDLIYGLGNLRIHRFSHDNSTILFTVLANNTGA